MSARALWERRRGPRASALGIPPALEALIHVSSFSQGSRVNHGRSGGLRPWRELLLALCLALAATALERYLHRREIESQTRFSLSSFDQYVYVAMADRPSFFTMAPWGYRILSPWLAHLANPRRVVRGYRFVTFSAFVVAGVLLFLFLRRMGHGVLASLLGMGVFLTSAQVGEAMGAVFLGEPIAVALEIACLLAIESGASTGVLCLLVTLGAFSKELFLLMPPLVYLAKRARDGRGFAAASALGVALPALLVTATLRYWWTPDLRTPHPPYNLQLVWVAFRGFVETWEGTWRHLLLAGLAPVAFLGALRKKARPFLARYGFFLVATTLLALFAWINIPSPTPVILGGPNVARLLIYTLPLLIPLALLALDRIWPYMEEPSEARTFHVLGARFALLGVGCCLAFPFVGLDRYRRLPFPPFRDGPLVFGLCQESLWVARQLERGRSVSWDLSELRFDPENYLPADLPHMRWFLRDGWGPHPHYGTGEVFMTEPLASLILPSLSSTPRQLLMTLSAPKGAGLDVRVNGSWIGRIVISSEEVEASLLVPGPALFRGDNLVTLQAESPATGVRLSRLAIAPIDDP